MDRFARVALVFAMVGCGGDEKDGFEPPEDTGSAPTAVPVDFVTAVDAGKVEGEIDPEAVRAHEIAETLSAAVGLVVADSNVQAMLNNDNGSGDAVTLTPPCWSYVGVTRPTEVTMDYTSCFDWGIEGGAFVRDHPAGPVLFDFKNLRVGGREVVGTLALAGLDSPNGWRIYESDGITPTLDNRVPMGVTIDGYTSGVRFEGSASIERTTLEATWWQWGAISIEDAYGAVSMVQGATDVAVIDPTVKPDTSEAAAVPLNWLNCRCPTAGALQYDATWTATQVEIDIDDLKVNDDGFDDPVILVDVSLPVSATATLTSGGCGDWAVDWPISGDVVHQVTGQQLYSLIEVKCSTLAIDDPEHCAQLLVAANAVETVDIRVGEAKLGNQASSALERAIDTGFCFVPEN
jgi:hypothetical protein